MAPTSPSPFARPEPDLRTKEGAPLLRRPSKEEMASFPEKAQQLLHTTWELQAPMVSSGAYDLRWMEGRHFLLAGATGAGLGGALAVAVLNMIRDSGSLMVIGHDLTRSLGYETGIAMQAYAEQTGIGNRFHWSNDGLALEGKGFERMLAALKEAGTDRVVYVNTIAAANCGLLPGYPPVFVKDVDEIGLFQWQLSLLSEWAIENTKFFMGTLAVMFPYRLELAGIGVEATVFADWRGSLDHLSRDPARIQYGRHGAYSTSLYLPKDIIQEEVTSAYRSGKIVIDCFFPIMRTQALSFVPGGIAMSRIYDTLMKKEGVPRIDIPELAVLMLDRVGRALAGDDDNPFPRLDSHEAKLDLWFYEIIKRLNNNEGSEFYFRLFV